MIIKKDGMAAPDTARSFFTISGDENEVLYYVDGSDPVHEKPVIVPTEKRYLVLDYENPEIKEKVLHHSFIHGHPDMLSSINRILHT